jgi:hypothetical protein
VLIVGMVCVIALISPPPKEGIPPFLIYLLFLIIGSYFSAHGNSIGAQTGEPSPFHLPSGTFRILILVALIGTVAYRVTNAPGEWIILMNNTVTRLKDEPYLPLIIMGGFFAGVVFHSLLGRHLMGFYVYQDLLAWVAIIAEVLMVISILIMGVINPSLQAQDPIQLREFDAVLGAVVAFYFAARS